MIQSAKYSKSQTNDAFGNHSPTNSIRMAIRMFHWLQILKTSVIINVKLP